MPGYTTSQVSEILGLTDTQIRSFVRSKLVEPARGTRNEYRFSFQDLILLRTARELQGSGVPRSRLRRALESLQARLPEGSALSSVSIGSDGDQVVVREHGAVWEPESGQLHIDFDVREVAERVAPLADRMIAEEAERELSAEDWFELAVELEPVSTEKAVEAYRRALAENPGHVFSHLNLGRILHEEGNVETAEGHYRQALAADPGSATAAFNLGVALEDLGRWGDAVDAYRRALKGMPDMASAHFNLARLHEKAGRMKEALRHLAEYKRLEEIEEST
jgi:tetratricopeptide (TPR) repeat protein